MAYRPSITELLLQKQLNPQSPFTPGINPAGPNPQQTPGLGKIGGAFKGLDGFLGKPGGMFLMNLLAQQGYSTMPQSRLGAVGRAALMTSKQQAGQSQAEAQRKLMEAQGKYYNAKASEQQPGPSIGTPSPEKFTPESLAEYQRTGNAGVLKLREVGNADYSKAVNEIADDVRTESKAYSLQAESYGRVQASANNPSPAGDLALIFNYMKVLDPGSTVREGEFANAQNSGSVPTQVRALYNQVTQGTRLTAGQRADFVNRAGQLFNSAVKIQQERNERARQRGRNAGLPDSFIDPILPVTDLVELFPYNPEAQLDPTNTVEPPSQDDVSQGEI